MLSLETIIKEYTCDANDPFDPGVLAKNLNDRIALGVVSCKRVYEDLEDILCRIFTGYDEVYAEIVNREPNWKVVASDFTFAAMRTFNCVAYKCNSLDMDSPIPITFQDGDKTIDCALIRWELDIPSHYGIELVVKLGY